VSVQSGAFKAGDTVEVVITALNNEAGLTLDSALFNGRALTNIIDNGDGTYTGTYTVVAGDADVLANNDVTTSLGFTDPAGNPGPLETTVTLSAGTDIEPAAYALRTFISYLDAASSGIAEPSLVTYEALGINNYYDGANYFDLTSELIALANEIVAGISGTLSANAIQAALDIASSKLTAMQKVLDYVADQNNPIPTAADYNAIDLGRTISSSEVAALNTAAVSAGVSAADTAAELALLLPIPSITIDSISEDTSDQPAVRDITLTTNAENSQDRVFALSDLQVGDYITLTLNGVSYVTANPVTDLSQSAVLNLIRNGVSSGGSATTAYSNWPGVAYNHSSDSILIRADSGVDPASLVVQAGGNAMPDFITSDDDGLTIVATLSAELAEGQRLELRTDSGAAWTDITDSVTGTAVSYDSSLATTATVEMRVVNAADTAGTVASQLITIDTTAPTITNPALSFGSVLSTSAVAAAATITVPLNGVEDGQGVTLTLNNKTYSSQATSDSASFTISSADLAALPGGSITYQVDVSDVAGNDATTYIGSFTKSVADFAGIDADADGSGVLEITDTTAVAGTSGSTDSTAKVALDVSKASVGDTVELYVDGTLVWSDTLDAGEISTGTLVADDGSGNPLDFDTSDSTVAGSGVNAAADIVTLEVKLKNSGGYVQEAEDVTWDYQW